MDMCNFHPFQKLSAIFCKLKSGDSIPYLKCILKKVLHIKRKGFERLFSFFWNAVRFEKFSAFSENWIDGAFLTLFCFANVFLCESYFVSAEFTRLVVGCSCRNITSTFFFVYTCCPSR